MRPQLDGKVRGLAVESPALVDPQGGRLAKNGRGEDRRLAPSPGQAVIFSYHTLGLGARKASIVFFAEELARLGWQTHFVTVQLSLLSALAGVPRLQVVPRAERNSWVDRGGGLSTYVWVPVLHPATTASQLVDRLATPLFRLYPLLLPRSVRSRVRSSRLVVVESSCAVVLLPLLRRLAPEAKIVYRACDPLDAVGMHPMLERAEKRTAREYDLFTSPSKLILERYPPDVRTCYLPQGLQKPLFDVAVPYPFDREGPHAIASGDMMFDRVSFEMMVRNFPDITFHAFGRMDLAALASCRNFIHHGEVPFETLRGYTLHADLGIAPYLDRPDIRYLAESSLKLVQYTYARLPIVAPHFCKGTRDHLKPYTPGDEGSIVRAVKEARRTERQSIDRSGVYDWHEIVAEMLRKVDLPVDAGTNAGAFDWQA